MSTRIDSLLAATDGTLWIGTAGGLSHWDGHHLTNYTKNPGVIVSIIEARTGSIWILMTPSAVLTNAATKAEPLCEIVGTSMRCHGESEGIPPDADEVLLQGSRGEFWIGGSTELIRWSPQSHAAYRPRGLERNGGMAGILSLAADDKGTVWVGIASSGKGLGLQRFAESRWQSFVSPQLNGDQTGVQQLFFDREKALWVGSSQKGLYRIFNGRVHHFGSAEGLSGDDVRAIFEDHEGNIWVVTTKGIDNFRDLAAVSFSKAEGLSSLEIDSVLATRDGSLWAGGYEALDKLNGSTLAISGKRLPTHQITSLFQDRSGRLWVGVEDKLAIYSNGSFRWISRRNGKPVGLVVGIAEDTGGDIWIESKGSPMTLMRIRNLKVQEEVTAPLAPAARRVAADTRGGLWLGLMNGDLARFNNGRAEVFHFSHDPDSRVEQLEVESDDFVIGATAFGLIAWDHGNQLTLTRKNGLPCDSVYAFSFDYSGDLWLNMQCGIVRISRADIQRWRKHSSDILSVKVLDVYDGAQPGRAPFVSAARTSEGRIWFANGTHLQMVDPQHPHLNAIPPPVHIEEIKADDKVYAKQETVLLPPLSRNLEIRYTALSFVAPQKVRFRYKLEGHDSQWQEAGTRRQAFYTDLRPGSYRFRVIACNNDGVWNERGAGVAFTVAPAWYQTYWFYSAVVACCIGILWLIHRLRVRQIEQLMSARFDERLAERTRLAREIHDTLIQTLQGSKMVADNALDVASDFPSMHSAMQRLSAWLGRATQEGREALNSLRTSTTETNNLAEGFRRALEEGRLQGLAEASFVSEGRSVDMHPIVRDEIYRIGAEAIRNAYQHSGATRIKVHLTYSNNLGLKISDNGSGIEQGVVANGKEGHFGLLGMRERALRIHAALAIESSPGAGTSIALTVPGSVVFRRSRSRLLTAWLGVKAWLLPERRL